MYNLDKKSKCMHKELFKRCKSRQNEQTQRM